MNNQFSLKIRDHIHTPAGKRMFNIAHFHEAAHRYDLATRLLSFGRDKHWKKKLIDLLPDKPPRLCLDLACGTGDITFLLTEKYPNASILGLDLTPAMIEHAERRNTFNNVRFTTADMCHTKLPDASVDVVTGGYALRNAPVLREALAEIWRILQPGGIAVFLDFAKPSNPWIWNLHYLLLKTWTSLWGLILHRNPQIHGYIAESLKQFPNRAQLKQHLEEAGFTKATFKNSFFSFMQICILLKTPNHPQ